MFMFIRFRLDIEVFRVMGIGGGVEMRVGRK